MPSCHDVAKRATLNLESKPGKVVALLLGMPTLELFMFVLTVSFLSLLPAMVLKQTAGVISGTSVAVIHGRDSYKVPSPCLRPDPALPGEGTWKMNQWVEESLSISILLLILLYNIYLFIYSYVYLYIPDKIAGNTVSHQTTGT